MKKKLISVLIPVYNSEEYLARSLDCILAQTYKNLEIVLVNDGSTDRSLEICRYYQKQDDRIVVFDKCNQGAAETRDFALEHAKGDIIAWMDNDDIVHPDFIYKMYRAMDENNSDMVVCNYEYTDERGKRLNWPEPKYKDKTLNSNEAIQEFLTTYNIEGFCWNKLAKKSLYFDNDIRYSKENNPFYCDMMVTIKMIEKSKSVSMVSDKLYKYCQNSSSMVHTHNPVNLYKYIDVIEEIADRCSNTIEHKDIEWFMNVRADRVIYDSFKDRKLYEEKDFECWINFIISKEYLNTGFIKFMRNSFFRKSRKELLRFLVVKRILSRCKRKLGGGI